MPADGQKIKNVDGNAPTTYTTWKLFGGPFHKTSKMSFKILELIGMFGSGVSLFVSGLLGPVVFIYSVAVSVGSTINPTIHIKYYQYGAADCMSYVREKSIIIVHIAKFLIHGMNKLKQRVDLLK